MTRNLGVYDNSLIVYASVPSYRWKKELHNGNKHRKLNFKFLYKPASSLREMETINIIRA